MFAVIFIPDFSLQAVLRHDPELRERAVALVDSEFARPLVVQLTSAAQAEGVCTGLTASQAMARCAGLTIKSRSAAQEESATEVLLQTAYAFSPNIESTAPGVCTLELKGLNFGSKGNSVEQWAEKIAQVLAQFYIEAKIGFAPTPELALLAARNVGESVLPAATLAIESFPVSSLEPPPEILEIFQRWGIRTVSELLALGKDQVTERLGPAAAELFNRVSPDSPRPLKLVVPTEEFAEQMEFENEIETTEPLLFVLRRFVEQLSRRLELIYLVVAEFHLQLGLSSGAKYERLFKIPAPTGNIEILFRMLQTHLETVRTDSPITSLRLAARPALPEAQQFGLFESTLRDPNQFAETVARLTGLCGADRVGTPELLSTHKPDSFAMAAPEFHSHVEILEGKQRRRSADIPVRSPACGGMNDQHGQFSSSAGVASPSPIGWERAGVRAGVHGEGKQKIGLQLRRFRPALLSHIEFRDEKPSLLRSHVFTGAIVYTRGPFFSSGNWWDSGRWAREEWDIETSDGSLFRIFRSAEGCFVEGVYD
jgi:protein ImuB